MHRERSFPGRKRPGTTRTKPANATKSKDWLQTNPCAAHPIMCCASGLPQSRRYNNKNSKRGQYITRQAQDAHIHRDTTPFTSALLPRTLAVAQQRTHPKTFETVVQKQRLLTLHGDSFVMSGVSPSPRPTPRPAPGDCSGGQQRVQNTFKTRGRDKRS